jgi:hypothetical protein
MLMHALLSVFSMFVHLVRINSPRNFPWWGYAVIAIIYSALAFRDDALTDGRSPISPGQGNRPFAEIALIHSVFLAAILCCLRMNFYLQSLLPDWMTNTFHDRTIDFSITDILFIFLMIVMHFIERRWLVKESEMDPSDLGEGFSATSRLKKK